MTPGRAAALSVRLEAERGRRLDRAFDEAANRLPPRERAFAHELSFGVTRLRGRLDHLLAPHVTRGLESVDGTVLELLRAGVYQMFYMGGVPEYAAVSATVDHVREVVAAAPAGFANAVLRKVQTAGHGPDRFPVESDDPLGFLTSWGAHPEWLIQRWLGQWSPTEVRRLVEANNTAPATYLTPLGTEPDAAVEFLSAAGIVASVVGRGSGCVRLDERGDVVGALTALPDSVVQDPAANLVTRYADVPPGTMVADLCAAPGGKALALSARPADILAVDRSESRIRMVRDNVRRTGRPVAVVVADALRPPLVGADAVLLDTPCTGTGTLARHPDARWRLRPESIGELTGVQDELLRAAADVVAPGGLLIYATCSLEPEENGQRIGAFLASHGGFAIEATAAVPQEFLDARGCLSVTPHAHGFDGAFAARMRRAR